MMNPGWGLLRSLFNKEVDENVREMMKSQKWLLYKGLVSTAEQNAYKLKVDSVKPEESFLLHKEFYYDENKKPITVFTEIEKGPRITFMASQLTFGYPLYIDDLRYANEDSKEAGKPAQKDYHIAFVKSIIEYAKVNFRQDTIGFKV